MPVDEISGPGMTREQIVNALTRLGELLWQQKRRGEIAVFGGTAMVLRHDFRAGTRDVDAKIEREHGAVIAASQEVARELGLPLYWLNEQATVYLSRKRDFSLFKTYPDEVHPGLLVYMASPSYLLAMKAVAGRPEDFDDAVRLARELGVKDAEELISLVSDYYPDEKAPERVRANAHEIARRIDAGKP